MERQVLMSLYDSTNGISWKKQSNWMDRNIPVNKWHGIHCHSDGSISKIKLSGIEMRGNKYTYICMYVCM